MAGSYELKKSGDKFMFNLKAGNGQVILSSQRYASRASAQNGIASVQRHCGDDSRYQRKTASNGKFHFSLLASNGQIIGTSQMYKTETSRDKGVESVKANGPSDNIRDETR